MQAAQLRDEEATDRLVLIIDEVESHLHPKWQRAIMPALVQVVKGLWPDVHLQALATSHSPLVLASLEPIFEEDHDRLFWFDLQDNVVRFKPYPWAIQGDVVGWLTAEIFGLDQARSREGEHAIEAAEAFMRGDVEKLPKELNSKAKIPKELERTLPGLDPFWPRWIVEANKSFAFARRKWSQIIMTNAAGSAVASGSRLILDTTLQETTGRKRSRGCPDTRPPGCK